MSEEDIHKKIDEKFEKIAAKLESTMRWYLGLMLALFLSWAIWISSDHLRVKKDIETYQSSLSSIIRAVSIEHPSNLILEYLNEQNNLNIRLKVIKYFNI